MLTLALDAPVQERFEALRRRHFPAGRNQVPAHVTLFHALPGDDEAELLAALARVGCERFPVTVTGLRFLGRGVAFTLGSPELARRRAVIASGFAGRLTAQDGAPFRPHVTIQNKVMPEAARALHASLASGFVPEASEAAAFHLWRYLGGPWEKRAEIELVPRPGAA